VQALRVCERSEVLGSGLACTYEESLANVIVGNEPVAVTFVCPQVRDAQDLEGGYALYTAPVWPVDAPQAIAADQT
jgi:hypothetical protein